jgi:hypothetical protein
MNWTDILKTVAPTVASAVLGPLGGIAVTAIGSAIGIDAPTQEKIAKAFTNGQLTPDALERLRTLELDYKNQEAERGFKYSELEFKNQDSARQMQMATHSKMPAVLTTMVTIGFFGILSLLFFHPELKGNEIVMIMVGQLSAVWAGCVSFYTGTTFGSANKNALLAQSQPAK